MAAANNPYYVSPPDILKALQEYDQSYKTASDDYRQSQNDAILKEVGAEIARGGITDSALGKLFSMSRSAGAPLGNVAAHLLAAKQQGQGFYGTPIWGVDSDTGRAGVGTFNKQGQFKLIDTGSFQPTPGITTVDTGTGTAVIDKKTGLPIGGGARPGTTQIPPSSTGQSATPGYLPKDLQGAATQRKFGEEVGDRAADLGKAKSALGNLTYNLDNMERTATELINAPGLKGITGIQGYFPNIRGSNASNAQAKYEALTSQMALNVLQAMRDASKTGGAVGQVTEREYPILQGMIAGLSTIQDKATFQREAAKVIEYTRALKDRLNAAYQQDYGGIQKPQQTTPITPQGQPPQVPQQGQGIRVPQNLSPAGLANWARANRIPSGTPLTLPDGSTIYAP